MFLSEPPRSQGDLHFSLFGIPVRVHPWFWLVGLFLVFGQLADRETAPDLKAALLILVPWLAALFLSILIHELGHAFMMRRYGFSPWVTLYGFGGLTSYKPSQQYSSRGMGTLGQVLISAAGPVAGFLLAGVIVVAVLLAGRSISVSLIAYFLPDVGVSELIGSLAFTRFVNYVLFISIFWGFVNLLPVYPLDGGNIAREVLLRVNPREGIRQSLVLSIVTGVLLAVLGLVLLRSILMGAFFGYLAYMSYTTLQAYNSRGPW